MIIFVRDSRNKILYPTIKEAWANKMVRKKKARWLRRGVVTLQLLYPVLDNPRDTKSYFALGLDSGYKNIGYCLCKVRGNKVLILLKGEALLRTEEIKELLTERKMYRQSKRRHRRSRANSHKFRHPRWRNRTDKSKISPTVRHLIESHGNVVGFICKHIPWNKLKINLEYGKFDLNRISQNRNKAGSKSQYNNIKAYVLARDSYTCQKCSAINTALEVHHKVERSNGGTDRPSNLITLCKSCHSKHHAGNINANTLNPKQLKDTGVLNTAMSFIYKDLAEHIPTYKYFGYETKTISQTYSIPKSHANDAMILSMIDLDLAKVEYIDFKVDLFHKQYRRHDRARVSRLEDRKYYLPGSKVAIANNRHKRTGQKKDSLAETKIRPVLAVPAKTLYRQKDRDFRPGDIVKNIKQDISFAVDRIDSGYKVSGYWKGEESPRQNPKAKFKQTSTVMLKHNSGLVLT